MSRSYTPRLSARRVAVLFAGLLVLFAAPVLPVCAQVVVRVLDVGQGEAVLITTPERRAILIDAGPDGTLVPRLRQYLDAAGIAELALVVATHPHADHIGGMPAVLSTFRVGAYLDNGRPFTSATYQRTMAMVERRQIRYLTAVPRTISVGSVELRVLPTPAAPTDNENDRSVGIVLTHGRFRALFPGDAEDDLRTFWRTTADLPSVTLLKVAHHGSHNGTDSLWLAHLAPRAAVVSLGRDNPYGHPHRRVADVLTRLHIPWWRTDRDGDVVFVGAPDGTLRVPALAGQRVTSSPLNRQP